MRGKDIKRYSYDFADKYLITSYNEYTDDDGIVHPSVNINEYPAVKKHLDYYWDAINTRQDKGETPYNLRRCAYMDDFFNPKIVFSEMVQSPQFYFDKDDFIVNDTVTFISGENLDVLIKCLNSHFIFEIYKRFYAGGGLGDQGIRLKKTFIQNLPIPYDIKFESENEDSIDGTIIQKIGLNQEEIHFLRYGH